MVRKAVWPSLSFAVSSLATWAAVAPAWAVGAAPAPPTGTAARSQACWSEADKKGLAGAERSRFHDTCTQGAMGTTAPTHTKAHDASSRALLAPSGQDRTTRSRACTAEADKKAANENDRKQIRLACLASAAPAGATETQQRPQTPTPAKPGYGALPH
jgi:hypothetical protein